MTKDHPAGTHPAGTQSAGTQSAGTHPAGTGPEYAGTEPGSATRAGRGDPPGLVPFGDVETAITREVEIIAARFPDTDVAVVERAVRDVFTELRERADVETHVLALTRHRVYDRLQEEGHPFQPVTGGTESASLTDPDPDAGSDTGLRAESA